MAKVSYSNSFEVLFALVTCSAMDKFVLHQPQFFANELQMDRAEIAAILNAFPGLFRKSKTTSKDYQDPFFALHLRYRRQGIQDGDGNKVERAPLDLKDIMPLIDFISRKAAEERQHSLGMNTVLITASLSLIASVVSLLVAFLKV